MTSTTLAAISGVVLQLLFEYLPGLESWFAGLGEKQKRLTMAGLMAVVAIVVFLLSCYTVWQAVSCNNNGIVQLVEAFIAALVANQAAHRVFKK